MLYFDLEQQLYWSKIIKYQAKLIENLEALSRSLPSGPESSEIWILLDSARNFNNRIVYDLAKNQRRE